MAAPGSRTCNANGLHAQLQLCICMLLLVICMFAGVNVAEARPQFETPPYHANHGYVPMATEGGKATRAFDDIPVVEPTDPGPGHARRYVNSFSATDDQGRQITFNYDVVVSPKTIGLDDLTSVDSVECVDNGASLRLTFSLDGDATARTVAEWDEGWIVAGSEPWGCQINGTTNILLELVRKPVVEGSVVTLSTRGGVNWMSAFDEGELTIIAPFEEKPETRRRGLLGAYTPTGPAPVEADTETGDVDVKELSRVIAFNTADGTKATKADVKVAMPAGVTGVDLTCKNCYAYAGVSLTAQFIWTTGVAGIGARIKYFRLQLDGRLAFNVDYNLDVESPKIKTSFFGVAPTPIALYGFVLPVVKAEFTITATIIPKAVIEVDAPGLRAKALLQAGASLRARVGVEFRNSEDYSTGITNKWTPYFSANATWTKPVCKFGVVLGSQVEAVIGLSADIVIESFKLLNVTPTVALLGQVKAQVAKRDDGNNDVKVTMSRSPEASFVINSKGIKLAGISLVDPFTLPRVVLLQRSFPTSGDAVAETSIKAPVVKAANSNTISASGGTKKSVALTFNSDSTIIECAAKSSDETILPSTAITCAKAGDRRGMRSLHNRALLADQAYTVEVDSSKAKKAGNVDISVTATDENYGMASQTVKATVEPASAAAQAPATTSPSSGSTSTGTGTSGSSSTSAGTSSGSTGTGTGTSTSTGAGTSAGTGSTSGSTSSSSSGSTGASAAGTSGAGTPVAATTTTAYSYTEIESGSGMNVGVIAGAVVGSVVVGAIVAGVVVFLVMRNRRPAAVAPATGPADAERGQQVDVSVAGANAPIAPVAAN